MQSDNDPKDAQPSLPFRPRLASNVAVHPPRAEGAPWVIERPGPKYFRVSEDIARLGRLLTGELDQDELLAVLDDRWDASSLTSVLTQFQRTKLLDDGLTTRPATRRLSVSPPLTVQLSLLDPTSLLRRVHPVIDALSRPLALGVATAIAVGGVVVLAASAPEVWLILGQPISGSYFLSFLALIFASTVVHELAHAAVLVRYGGRPRRMGVMLFYLLPAFFCDVSDGWLLPHNRQRIRVALAGIAAQASCAGLIGLVAVGAAGDVRELLLLASAALYAAAVINFVPFVKLDGYLALMAWLDISNLRNRARDDARSYLASVAFGSRRERQLPALRWAVPFGLCCLLFPIYLVAVVAFGMWSRLLVGTGFLGAVLGLLLAAVVLTMAAQGLVGVVQHAVSNGASRLRVGGVLLGAAAVLGIVLTQITVTDRIPGYYRIDSARVSLVLPAGSSTDRVLPAQEVELRTNGIVLQRGVGAAVVGQGGPERISLSAFQFLPIGTGIDDMPVEFWEFPLEVPTQPEQQQGVAFVTVGEAPLWSWFYHRYVALAL